MIMKKLKTNHVTPTELLGNIRNDYKVINGYLANGDLLTLLNSTAAFTSKETHSLIFSFNQFKTYTTKLKPVLDLFIMTLNSCFISETLESIMKKYLFSVMDEEDVEIMMNFFLNCFVLLPNQSVERLSLFIPCLFYASQSYVNGTVIKVRESLNQCLGNIKGQPTTFVHESDSEENKLLKLSAFPQYSDIFPKLQSNSQTNNYNCNENTNTKYESAEHFILTQFLSLKHEFVKPLIESIKEIKAKMFTKSRPMLDLSQFKIYENVAIEDLYPFKNKFVHRIYCLDVVKSSTFIPGSLICLTNNFFDSLYFATIVDINPSNLSKGILMVHFDEDPVLDLLTNNNFIMVETKIQSETYQNVLKKLLMFSNENFPFKDYILHGDYNFKKAVFLDSFDFMNISATVEGEMDSCENEAFVHGLRHNLTLIKGLPGTGKTFLCMKIIKYIVDNYQHKNIGPILVVCYTDETLHQVVLDITKTVGINNVVELSNSQKNDCFNECHISKLKLRWIKKRAFPNDLLVRSRNIEEEIEFMKENLSRKYREIINCDKRILPVSKLTMFMSESHTVYFQSNNFDKWLKNEDALIKTQNENQKNRKETTELCVYDSSKYSYIVKSIINRLATVKPLTEEEYDHLRSLDIDLDNRIRIYKYWLQKYRDSLLVEYEFEKENFFNLTKEKEGIVTEESLLMMRSAKVIVMTTSSAARNAMVLDKLGCRIVIFKEANLIPETHVLSSLTDQCQQLIMIGYHYLTKKENCILDQPGDEDQVTKFLFEKLIKNKCHCFKLICQYSVSPRITSTPDRCDVKLNCGHLCPKSSHPKKPTHKGFKCSMKCMKKCTRNLHSCERLCSEICFCEKEIIVTLICGHEKELICSQEENTIKCTENCDNVLGCGHRCKGLCGEDCKCLERLRKQLPCGHFLEYFCGNEILNYECVEMCNRVLKCGHLCKKRCVDPCTCTDLFERTLPCGHRKLLKCGVDISNALCDVIFKKEFKCGHNVKYKCSERIQSCNIVTDKLLNCGHLAKVKCGQNMNSVVCQNVCNVKLLCQHFCEGVCGECYLGRFHINCKFKCEKYLKCGHICNSLCHVGFCPPCDMPCDKYCLHSICSSKCGENCQCKVCTLDCKKSVICLNCKKTYKCSKICGETCSTICKMCHNISNKENNRYFVMEPCKCKIEKEDFKAQFHIVGKEAVLKCQNCLQNLSIPYEGVVLLLYKKEYSAIFQLLPDYNVNKWSILQKEIFKYSFLSYNDFQDILFNFETNKICIEDMPNFDIAYKKFRKIESICKTISIDNSCSNLDKFKIYTKKSLFYICKWLNPFHRNFGKYETYIFKVEKYKLEIIADLHLFLNSASISEYALLHKSCFEVLDKLLLLEYKIEITSMEAMVKEIKNYIKSRDQSTEEEDKFVAKIINSKNVLKDFDIEKLTTENKLKELKKLILKCHPDKNKSAKANEAVRILLKHKQSLESFSFK